MVAKRKYRAKPLYMANMGAIDDYMYNLGVRALQNLVLGMTGDTSHLSSYLYHLETNTLLKKNLAMLFLLPLYLSANQVIDKLL